MENDCDNNEAAIKRVPHRFRSACDILPHALGGRFAIRRQPKLEHRSNENNALQFQKIYVKTRAIGGLAAVDIESSSNRQTII